MRAWATSIAWLIAGAVATSWGCGPAAAPISHFGGDGGGDPEGDDSGSPTDDGGSPSKRDASDSGLDAQGPPATIVKGASDRILLIGTFVTPDTIVDGRVLVEADRITCAAAGDECAKRAGADGATIIDTHAIIAPGLVDTHNHILFDIFDESDWAPSQLYTNHEAWTQEARYAAMLDVKQCLANDSQGKPAWCAQTPYGTSTGSLRCEMNKYGELKGLVAGTTSIVGLPGTSSSCFGSLARSIDVPQSGLGTDSIQTSSTFPPSTSSASAVCTNFSSGKTAAYLVHCGEGTDQQSLDEFATLGTVSTPDGCLYASQTAITHGTAFTAAQFSQMAAAGMKLIWSPRSNVSLYGATTNVPAALDANVLVALAPDWSMGGSQNMLDELRFADRFSSENWNGRLAAKDLVTMATRNGAKVLGLDHTIGVIEEGALADLAVFGGDRAKPYESIVAARPADVRLVMVGGTVLYGDPALAGAAPAEPACETIDVCGTSKFACVATTTTTSKLDQTFETIRSSLEQALGAVDAVTPEDGWNFAPLTPLVRCE